MNLQPLSVRSEDSARRNILAKDHLSLWAQSLLYVLAGINHFIHSDFYVPLIPDHYAHPGGLVVVSGCAEVAGGVGLLVPATRRKAAFGIMLMLLIFLDVHVSMLLHADRFPEVPVWLLWARLLLQFGLIAWAGWYARRKPLTLTTSGPD